MHKLGGRWAVVPLPYHGSVGLLIQFHPKSQESSPRSQYAAPLSKKYFNCINLWGTSCLLSHCSIILPLVLCHAVLVEGALREVVLMRSCGCLYMVLEVKCLAPVSQHTPGHTQSAALLGFILRVLTMPALTCTQLQVIYEQL